MIIDAHTGSADGNAGTRAPGLITWRDTADGSGAYLGEMLVGEIWRRANPKTHPLQKTTIEHWGWMFDITQLGGEEDTRDAARLALSAAVAVWVARAGLVHKSASYAAMMNDDCDPRSTP